MNEAFGSNTSDLLVEWNDTAVEYPVVRGMHELFEQQVELMPHAVAVIFEDQQLTYQQLNGRANQLAHYLRSLGVGPEKLVGLCLERSPLLVVCILGILKAGGTYVPLDAKDPPQRLRFMLQDAAVQYLVTRTQMLDRMPLRECHIHGVVVDNLDLKNHDRSNPPIENCGDNLAYAMYTSGSTGQPKGVAVTHDNVTNLLLSIRSVLGLGTEMRFLGIASPTFDISVAELFLPLISGATAILVRKKTARDASLLARAISVSQPHIVQATPASWKMLLDSGWSGSHTLTLISTGEAFPQSLVRRLLDVCGKLYDFYGPTETTIWSTIHHVADERECGLIGRPIANTQVYLLDAQKVPVPIGEAGELYIGGAGIARGYLNRPELTAERFVANPFSDNADARVFRTGDLCRWSSNGNLEFLGRLDNQVKLRGFRIELGEIESVLNKHADVAESVVIMREDHPGEKRLVAFCVTAAGTELNVTVLRSHLRRHLPEYMIPATFVEMDRLPLTSHGKIDRRGLPIPEFSRPQLDIDYVAPRNLVEEQLANVWCEVLRVDRVGIHDNFLELGGNSLLATQIVSRIRNAFTSSATPGILFEHSNIAELARWLEVHRENALCEANETIPIASRCGPLPLSSAQQRAWLMHQLDNTKLAYNFQAVFKFNGSLNVGILQRCLSEIVSRHEIFRTTISIEAEQPTQQIHLPRPVHLPQVDLRAVDESTRKAVMRRHIEKEIHEPFDLAALPLIRWRLLRLDETQYAMIHVEHHLIHDGWSFNVFLRELVELYRAYSVGKPSPLRPLALQYVDFTVWQRKWLDGADEQTQIDYWKKRLAGCPPLLKLPYDRTRPATPTYRGAACRLEIPAELHRALFELGQQHRATLFMTMFAAFTALMHRYSGQTDVCIGSGFANRNRHDVEDMIGMFVNNLVLRVDVSGSPTFAELLEQVRAVMIDAAANQDMPFDRVVDAVAPDRDPRYNPLFQVMFSFHDSPMPQSALPDVDVKLEVPISNGTAKFDLNVIGVPHTAQRLGSPKDDAGDMTLIWEFSTDLFEHSTIERMMGHFMTLLEGIVAEPDRPLSELQLLTAAQRHQLLVEFNDTSVDYPRDKCIHGLFEEQVARTPEAIAVVFADRELTYRELNERANQLAHQLIGLGVGPETLVGLCLERSAELIVGILGILKAGGAYVPLDVDDAAPRLQFMLSDANVRFLVTQQRLLIHLPATGCQAICLDADAASLCELARSNPQVNVAAENLAYVMFTSGSTGQPKGVAVTHSSIANLIFGNDYATFGADRVFLQLANTSFDASTFEVWGALLHGAKLVVSPLNLPDFLQLEDLLKRNRVTTLWLTSTFFNQVVEHYPQALDRVDEILTGGEVVSIWHIRKAQAALGNCVQFINGYGPTENTTFSTCYRIPFNISSDIESIPIGRPIANSQAYVLDAHQQPVPVGVPGELYIGGAGLARGYLNRTELTAEKFVFNPFSDDPKSRLYRTGDRCCWRADRSLEFLGRLDNQVKLRGFRIELGEIESVLNGHADVADCVVIMREDLPGEKRLVAYCVAATGAELNLADLRIHLCSRLPEYMVPTVFVNLETLPVTSSGKIDRRGLPAPDDSRPERESGIVCLSNPVEQQLASIWSEILGVETVGIHENFFSLGGHSLLASRINLRIAVALEVDLPLRRLFELPTIAELSREIITLRNGEANSQASSLQRIERESIARLPLSFAQQRLWFLEQMEKGLTAYNIPYSWKLLGALDVEALRLALEETVRRHQPLRTTYTMLDEQPVQVIMAIKRFDLPLVDLSSFESERQQLEVVRRCHWEAERPFDLSSDLMLRASLLRLAANEHVLLLTMHHIATDGWSLRVLWRELDRLYDACGRNAGPELPELPVDYADYAVWQRKELHGPRGDRLTEFWREQLNGLSPLELPTDRPRLPKMEYYGARCNFDLPPELVEELKSLSQAEAVTLHMTLLAAFQTLLSRYSGQNDIAVGVPVAGRNHTGLENLIGFFVNTLVVRTDLSADPTFRQLLGRIRQFSLAAYDHQDLPFDRLVEELRPERHLSRGPLIQVLFQLSSFADQDLTLRDLEVTRLSSSSQRVRFDLEMHLRQHDKHLQGTMIYSTNLFDQSTIERMIGHFLTMLSGIVANVDQRISELPLLPQEELQQLLVQWNDTAVDYPLEKRVHQLFEEQVERTPDAIAVIQGFEKLSFRQLNDRADRLASYLRNEGVKAQTCIGLCVGRCPDLVAGILGILKAGGTYVMLDPAEPLSRTMQKTKDLGVCHVITQRGQEKLFQGWLAEIVCIEQVCSAQCAPGNPDPLGDITAATDPAYVIFTSGSEGVQKGVVVSHRSLANFALATIDRYVISSTDRRLQFASVTSDVLGAEIFPYLLSGASIVFPTSQSLLSIHEMLAVISEQKISVVGLPSVYWHEWVVALQENAAVVPDSLRLIVSGMDHADPMHFAIWQNKVDRNVRWCNAYGPSEATITSTTYEANHLSKDRLSAIPIGRPIANVRIYILDQRRNPVPIGVPGELYIGGNGVAIGYHNLPELTAERFITDPFSTNSADRLYASGDMARYLPDGNIQFLGRSDSQMKIRGFRVESQEIESVLRLHPRVKDAAVCAQDRPNGDKRLVCFVVCDGSEQLTTEDLVKFLKTRLPHYMLPSAFVLVNELPLNQNRKIDRRALMAQGTELESKPQGQYVAPRTPIEEILCEFWSEVLSRQKTGIHDNFFELGGHSMMAIRVVSRIQTSFHIELPVRVLFELPTVYQLALHILEELTARTHESDGLNVP